MNKILKDIVDKIELRNRLNEEIREWMEDHLDLDGMDVDGANIADYYTGNEQGTEECKEWCDQTCLDEDWYIGDYFWETECTGKYLHMRFEL